MKNASRLRIAFITNNYTPYSGGVVSSLNAISAALRKQGHEVCIITLDFLGKKHHDPAHVFRIACPIKFLYKKNHIAVPWRPTKQVNELIKKLMPDIMHVHHPFLLGKSGLKVARTLGIPIVFTYHTMYEHYIHYIPLPQFFLLPITQKLVHNFCKAVDHIIAPSCAIKDILKSFDKPITHIPSPLQSIFLTDKPGISARKNNIFTLLAVSRFAKEKNLPFLLDVLAQLPEHFILKLVGYGPQEAQLRAYAYHKLGLHTDRVQFILKPPQEKLAQLYQEADLFLFSSKTDTQGLVLAEAMAAGTPVIAVDGPGQRDSIEHGVNGFIVQGVDQMAQKICELAGNNFLLTKLSQNAWDKAQHYRPSEVIQNLLKVYYSLLL